MGRTKDKEVPCLDLVQPEQKLRLFRVRVRRELVFSLGRDHVGEPPLGFATTSSLVASFLSAERDVDGSRGPPTRRREAARTEVIRG